jgi:protein AbiQ
LGEKELKYIFLTSQFFQEYNNTDYPEIEQKADRPYIMIRININGIDFAIPLRSGISHNNALWTNKPNKCGVDYSKAVIIPDASYIDGKAPHIRPDEFKALLGKDYLLKTGFEKYIEDYKEAYKNQHIDRNRTLCKYSTLQYYHKEIGII